MVRNISSLDYHFHCKSIFVLAYSYETDRIGLKFGDDSFLNHDDAKVILDKQVENVDAYGWVDYISGLISNIQTGALKKQEDDREVFGLAAVLSIIAVVVGFSGNVLCIVAILFTKLIQNPFNKYLLVLLISDTLFILWFFGTALGTLYVNFLINRQPIAYTSADTDTISRCGAPEGG
ncbi:hypothetical protein Ddc_16211 [Ditylenchus destructor]|nr:hypothetical protein Ddc_16211 [Ditylenchus destructor]